MKYHIKTNISVSYTQNHKQTDKCTKLMTNIIQCYLALICLEKNSKLILKIQKHEPEKQLHG